MLFFCIAPEWGDLASREASVVYQFDRMLASILFSLLSGDILDCWRARPASGAKEGKWRSFPCEKSMRGLGLIGSPCRCGVQLDPRRSESSTTNRDRPLNSPLRPGTKPLELHGRFHHPPRDLAKLSGTDCRWPFGAPTLSNIWLLKTSKFTVARCCLGPARTLISQMTLPLAAESRSNR